MNDPHTNFADSEYVSASMPSEYPSRSNSASNVLNDSQMRHSKAEVNDHLTFQSKYEINVPQLNIPYMHVKHNINKFFHPFSSAMKSNLSPETHQFIDTSLLPDCYIYPIRVLFDSIKSIFSNYLYESDLVGVFGDILHPPYIHFIWLLYDINIVERITYNEFFLVTIMFIHLRPQQMLDLIFNLFDEEVNNQIDSNNYRQIIENLSNRKKEFPPGFPSNYKEIVEIYEDDESKTVLSRLGFYKFCHDFPEVIEEPIKFQSSLQDWFYRSITSSQAQNFTNPIQMDIRPFIQLYKLRCDLQEFRSTKTCRCKKMKNLPLRENNKKQDKYLENRYCILTKCMVESDTNLDRAIQSNTTANQCLDSCYIHTPSRHTGRAGGASSKGSGRDTINNMKRIYSNKAVLSSTNNVKTSISNHKNINNHNSSESSLFHNNRSSSTTNPSK